MKEKCTKNYVPLLRGRRKYKLFTSDLKKIFKIQKKVIPTPPPFERISKLLPSTDIDEDVEERITN